MIAKLIEKDISSSLLTQKIVGGENEFAQKVIEEIEVQKGKIVVKHPNAEKYLMYPFYCGLRYKAGVNALGEHMNVVTYFNGAKDVVTKTVTSQQELAGYC